MDFEFSNDAHDTSQFEQILFPPNFPFGHEITHSLPFKKVLEGHSETTEFK